MFVSNKLWSNIKFFVKGKEPVDGLAELEVKDPTVELDLQQQDFTDAVPDIDPQLKNPGSRIIYTVHGE